MTANPLRALKPLTRQSKFSALQWAQMAREKGLKKHAEAWEKAARDGWDDLHYQPEITQ